MSAWKNGSRCADTSRSHSYSSFFHSDAGLPIHTGGVQAERAMMEQSSAIRIDGPPQTNAARIALLPVMWSEHDMRLLYDLLAERTPEQSISHKDMPTWEAHRAFVGSRPYAHWYLIYVPRVRIVGSIYLTHQREIGVSIFRAHQRKGHGRAAVLELMRLHPGRFLANVNPANAASRKLWESLGGKLLQVTYDL